MFRHQGDLWGTLGLEYAMLFDVSTPESLVNFGCLESQSKKVMSD
jgi:hypothetical protein